jgi:hypothetical protein
LERPGVIKVGGNPMTCEIKESDWKFLRRVHTVALERYCEQILLEIRHVNLDKSKSFHQRYLDIFKVLHRRDKEMAETFDGLRRSRAYFQLASMKSRGMVTGDDILCFSQETRDAVNLILGERRDIGNKRNDAKES